MESHSSSFSQKSIPDANANLFEQNVKERVKMSLMLGTSKSRAVLSRIVSSPVLIGRKGRSAVTASSAITARNEGKPIESILIANRGEIALYVHVNLDLSSFIKRGVGELGEQRLSTASRQQQSTLIRMLGRSMP